jgi:ABC-type polysaccharide/polyol phosphate transport system ATPase subunit
VGAGFHPELTGRRENVYSAITLRSGLNGTVLGMSRQEIGRKFDETCPEPVEGLRISAG